MKWINEHLKVLVLVAGLISAGVALQIQAAQNAKDIKEEKEHQKEKHAEILTFVQKEVLSIKLASEKNYTSNKKEIEKVKAEQKQNTEIKINQQYLREDMKELKAGFKEILLELRSKP